VEGGFSVRLPGTPTERRITSADGQRIGLFFDVRRAHRAESHWFASSHRASASVSASDWEVNELGLGVSGGSGRSFRS
jgi:hypothetical protein